MLLEDKNFIMTTDLILDLIKVTEEKEEITEGKTI
jgi:hypothetical protein